MAVSSCSRLLQLDPDATLGLLPYVLPVLMERLQCDEVMTHAAFWWHTQQNVSCVAKSAAVSMTPARVCTKCL